MAFTLICLPHRPRMSFPLVFIYKNSFLWSLTTFSLFSILEMPSVSVFSRSAHSTCVLLLLINWLSCTILSKLICSFVYKFCVFCFLISLTYALVCPNCISISFFLFSVCVFAFILFSCFCLRLYEWINMATLFLFCLLRMLV